MNYRPRPQEVRELMRRDLARLLWISDKAARRGGLERWQEPKFEKDGGVHIPSVEELRRLKAAVCIDRSDLEIRFGGLEGFSDLCWPTKRIPWRRDRTRLTNDRALLFPLSLNASSSGLIVPSPNQLALSVVHRVAARAAASGVHRHLMAAFERAVLAETERLCQQMRWVPLGSSLTLPPSSNVQDAVFAFDVDKIAHVVVFADDLDGYEAARPHAATDSTSQMQRINKRMQHVCDAVRAVDPAGEVLHLMLMVPIGRPMHADFAELEGEGRSVLLLTIDELRTIAYHERDDSLGLWRFAKALDELPLPGYGTVNNAADAYALYLQSDRRPRRLGGPEARGILLPPGFGAPLTVRERRRSDAHAVHLPDGSRAVPVSREAVNESVRVYVPQREDLRHLRLVELALPCWVGAHGVGTQSQRFCAGVADALSLHLWRIRDLVDPHLDKIAEDASCVAVDIVDPDGSVLSFADVDNADNAPWFEIAVDHDHHRITVRLLPNAAVRLSQVADAAEEELIVEVARSLTSLAGRPSADMDADLADVGVHEGPRFMHVGIGYVPGVHGGAQLPGCRLKYHVEIDAVVDEIDAIASGLGLEFGTVPAERRVEIIVEIVRTLNGRLRKKLRELDPDTTFELLVSEQERMQRDRTMLRVMAPNPFTDAGNGGDMPSAIEKYREIDQSALASRYLIELAVRCVRGGHRPMSLSRYDELLAISQQMIAVGSIGDAYRLGLSDAELHFREPGCLRMGLSDPYCQAVGDRTDINARALGAQDLLAEWAKFMASQDRVPAVDLSDESAVFEAEFGVPFIGFLEAVERLSELAAGNDVQVRTMPVPDLLPRSCRDDRTRPTAGKKNDQHDVTEGGAGRWGARSVRSGLHAVALRERELVPASSCLDSRMRRRWVGCHLGQPGSLDRHRSAVRADVLRPASGEVALDEAVHQQAAQPHQQGVRERSRRHLPQRPAQPGECASEVARKHFARAAERRQARRHRRARRQRASQDPVDRRSQELRYVAERTRNQTGSRQACFRRESGRRSPRRACQVRARPLVNAPSSDATRGTRRRLADRGHARDQRTIHRCRPAPPARQRNRHDDHSRRRPEGPLVGSRLSLPAP